MNISSICKSISDHFLIPRSDLIKILKPYKIKFGKTLLKSEDCVEIIIWTLKNLCDGLESKEKDAYSVFNLLIASGDTKKTSLDPKASKAFERLVGKTISQTSKNGYLSFGESLKCIFNRMPTYGNSVDIISIGLRFNGVNVSGFIKSRFVEDSEIEYWEFKFNDTGLTLDQEEKGLKREIYIDRNFIQRMSFLISEIKD